MRARWTGTSPFHGGGRTIAAPESAPESAPAPESASAPESALALTPPGKAAKETESAFPDRLSLGALAALSHTETLSTAVYGAPACSRCAFTTSLMTTVATFA
jgi:hypothetical protein